MGEEELLAQIRHEIALQRELLEEKIKALDEVLSCRLDSMDKALELVNRQDSLAHLAQRFEELVERLSHLEKDKARHGGID